MEEKKNVSYIQFQVQKLISQRISILVLASHTKLAFLWEKEKFN